MELFKLLGKIAIDNADANKAIGETTDAAKKSEQGLGDLAVEGEKTEGRLGKAFSKVGGAAVKVGKIIGTGMLAAGAAVGGLAIKALNLGGELEQNLGGSEAVFKDYAGRMQEIGKSAFKDMGLSQSDFLATANKMGALFQGAGMSIQESSDLSAAAMQRAADVASIMGIDTSAAMEAVAGAAKGNFTMMDNLGVAMNDTQIQAYALSQGINKSTQEMTQQEKIGLAMEMFLDKTAYAAGNYAKENETLAGSLSTSKAALQNFLAGSGSTDDLVTSLVGTANVITDRVAELLPRLVTGLSDLLTQLVPKIPPLIQKLLPGVITGAVALLNGVLAALPSLIGIILDALPMFIDGVLNLLMGIIDALPSVIQSIVTALPALIPQLINGVTSFWVALMENLPAILSIIIDVLPDLIISIVDALMNNLPTLINVLVQLVVGIVAALPDIILGLLNALPTVVVSILGGLWASLPVLLKGLADIVLSIFSAIWDLLKPLVSWIGDFFGGLWESIKSIFKPVIEFYKNIFERVIAVFHKIVDPWIEIFKRVFQNIKAFVSDVWSGITAAFTKAWETIKSVFAPVANFFTDIWNGIKGAFGAVTDWFKNIFSNAWSAVKNVFSTGGKIFDGIKDGISNVFKTVVNGLIGGINRVISVPFNAINAMLKKIKEISIVGVKPFDWIRTFAVPQIPQLAKGAVVSGPRIVEVGEDGDEAIVPIERNTGWIDRVAERLGEFNSSSPGAVADRDEKVTVQLNIENFINNRKQDIEQLVDEISEIMEAKRIGRERVFG